MPDHLSLVRKSQTIVNFLNAHLKHEPGNGVRQFFSVLKVLQHIFPQWVLLSCPAQHPGVFFITENSKNVLGYADSDFTSVDHSAFLLSRLHHDDLQDMNRCFSFIESFLKETMPHEYIHLRFVLQYRFLHKSGHYITIHQEQAILPISEDQPLYYSILKDVSDEVVFGGVKLEIFKCKSLVEKVAEFHPGRQNMKLSRREQDVIDLMQNGLSTKEIADRLSISRHTARNIKQKMFEKYKVNNSISLLNKAVYHQ